MEKRVDILSLNSVKIRRNIGEDNTHGEKGWRNKSAIPPKRGKAWHKRINMVRTSWEGLQLAPPFPFQVLVAKSFLDDTLPPLALMLASSCCPCLVHSFIHYPYAKPPLFHANYIAYTLSSNSHPKSIIPLSHLAISLMHDHGDSWQWLLACLHWVKYVYVSGASEQVICPQNMQKQSHQRISE